MRSTDDDIRWLARHQPQPEPPSAESTGRARAALLDHAERASWRAPAVVAAPPRRRRRAPIAAAVLVAAAIAAAVTVMPGSGGSGIETALTPGVASAQTLVALADHVAGAPRTGDATLVFHRNDVQGERPFTGADLYLDNGRYFYAETPAGLPAAIKAGPQDFSLKPVIDAMAAAGGASPQDARAAYLKAVAPLYGGALVDRSVASEDNVIWVSGIDVLGAAYGRPAVLAGTLRALSTVHGVVVKHGTFHGVRTLEISMWVPKSTTDLAKIKRALDAKLKAQGKLSPAEKVLREKAMATLAKTRKVSTPAHFMRATLNAGTGALLHYTDIGLVVSYHVTRVDAATYR
jgi:hypothetical protein